MKIFILEGQDVEQRNASGKPIMAGWRHYMVIRAGKKSCCIGRADLAEKMAETFRAKLFRRGVWETPGTATPEKFATLRPEIHAEIFNDGADLPRISGASKPQALPIKRQRE